MKAAILLAMFAAGLFFAVSVSGFPQQNDLESDVEVETETGC